MGKRYTVLVGACFIGLQILSQHALQIAKCKFIYDITFTSSHNTSFTAFTILVKGISFLFLMKCVHNMKYA